MEEGATRRKEQRGGRSDEESKKTEKMGKKEKMNKWLEDPSLTTSVLYEVYGILVVSGTPGIEARGPHEVHKSLMALWP